MLSAESLWTSDSSHFMSNCRPFKQSPALQKASVSTQGPGSGSLRRKQASFTRAVYDARRKRALDSPTEAALTTRTMQQLAGIASTLDTGNMLALASPLRGANPALAREMNQAS